ncbi:MAG: ABC transporter substrate-binding protein [Oscillospiraceae bacterium]
MKKLLAFSLAVCMAVLFAACAGGSSSAAASGSGQASAGTGEEAVIRICWWGSQTRTDKTNAVLKMYEEQNPGVTFQAEFSDYSGYWDKLATQAAAKSMPDIIQMDISQVAQYQSKGLLENLTPYIESGALDMSKVPENFISGGLVDGNMYVITLGLNAPVMLFDKDIVEQAGVTLNEKMTWDEFSTAAKTIYEKTGVRTYLPYGDNDFLITMVARGKNQTLYNAAEHKLGMPDASTAVEFFSYYEKGVNEGWLVTAEQLAERSTALEEMPIVDGTTWNTFVFSNQMETMDTIAGKDFGYTMPPYAADDVSEGLYLKPSMSFGISAESQYKDICADFISFFTNSELANETLNAERGVPINTDIAEMCKQAATPSGQKAFDYVSVAEENSKAIDPAGPAGSGEVNTLLKTLLEQILYKQITGEQAGNQFFEEGNAILQKSAA